MLAAELSEMMMADRDASINRINLPIVHILMACLNAHVANGAAFAWVTWTRRTLDRAQMRIAKRSRAFELGPAAN
jgi:hypothetical protein